MKAELIEHPHERINETTGFIETIYFKPFRGHKACWPYVVYSGFKGFIWLINAYDSKYIYRVESPYENKKA